MSLTVNKRKPDIWMDNGVKPRRLRHTLSMSTWGCVHLLRLLYHVSYTQRTHWTPTNRHTSSEQLYLSLTKVPDTILNTEVTKLHPFTGNVNRWIHLPSKHETLTQCWASVADAGPTLNQHCVNVRLLGILYWETIPYEAMLKHQNIH